MEFGNNNETKNDTKQTNEFWFVTHSQCNGNTKLYVSPFTETQHSTVAKISYHDYVQRIDTENFHLEQWMQNFRGTSCDPERLFSYGRISKNFLQNRMTAENHSRNVFLNKNKSFLENA